MSSPDAITKAQDNKQSLEKLLQDIESLQTVVASFDERERNTVEALRRAIDTLHKEALTQLIRALKTTPEAMAALKEASTDDVVYSVLRHHNLIKPSLNERIEQALDSVLSLIHI